jgi:hypothetical protein
MYRMCFAVAMLASLLVAAGCRRQVPDVITDNRISITAPVGFEATIKAYRLPRGSFKGFNWEFDKDKAFRIWMIDWRSEDVYIYIPVDKDIMAFTKDEPDSDWVLDANETDLKRRVTYTLSRQGGNISMQIRLPIENEKLYSLGILRDDDDRYMIVFGNTSDYAKHENDRGLFGYAIIKPTLPKTKTSKTRDSEDN